MTGISDELSGRPEPATGRRLALYAIAYAGSTAIHKALGFVIFMWLAYELPVPAYAAFGLLYAIYSGVGALSMAGIVDSVIGLLVACPTPEARRRLFTAAERVFYAMASVCAFVVGICVLLLRSATALSWIAIAAATTAGLLTGLFTVRSHLRRLEEDHHSSLLLNFLPPVAALLGGSIAFVATQTVTGFYCGFALAMLTGFLRIGLNRAGRALDTAQAVDMKPIAARIGPFVLVAMLAWFGGYGNTWLVQALFTAEDVARFAFIYTLASVMQMVANSLNQVWSPRIFRQLEQQSVAVVDASSSRFFKFQGLVLGTFGALLLLGAPRLVELGGTRFIAYAKLDVELFLLLAAYAMAIPWYHVQNYFLAFGRGRELLNLSLVSTAIGVALWGAAMWAFGPIGAYIGFLVLTTARTVAAQWLAWRMWQVSTIWQGPLLALIILIVGGAASRVMGG